MAESRHRKRLTVGSGDFRLTASNQIANLTDKPWPSINWLMRAATAYQLLPVGSPLSHWCASFWTGRQTLKEAELSHLIHSWSLKFPPGLRPSVGRG